MKGDFTRSTFRKDKHYTSVRMQQGRLQLDSDWNEQADIQTHLRRAQVTDMIGSGSGASKVDPFTGQTSENSFKPCLIRALDDQDQPMAWDIALLPGHFYVNGILCELAPGSEFGVERVTTNEVSDTFPTTLRVLGGLTIDGRQLQVGDWLVIKTERQKPGETAGDNNEDQDLTGVRISDIDQQTRKITVMGSVLSQFDAGVMHMQRVLTYSSQPDFPTDATILDREPGDYFAYLDVWERHITALDDRSLQEVALNVPDTTTRTQTLWQLKLHPSPGSANSSVDRLETWTNFENRELRRELPLLNARVAGGQGGSELSASHGRLGNHLYRVEVHDAMTTHGPPDQKALTFKWSRENGSIASEILRLEGGDTIRIRKSSQVLWQNSISGQWLEILSRDQELKGEPGALVPLRRISDTKIEFDPSGIVGPLPEKPCKVRRWDHNQTNVAEGAIHIRPGQNEWVELEHGIQVRFGNNETSETSTLEHNHYRTGDYWLIPSREATNNIEWPTDEADKDVTFVEGQAITVTQPIAQRARGVEHNHALLATLAVSESSIGDESTPTIGLQDQRIVFPPLLRALDRAGGTITGNLAIKENLSVAGSVRIIGDPNNAPYGAIKVASDRKDVEYRAENGTPFVFHECNVGIGELPGDTTKLAVSGNVAITGDLEVKNVQIIESLDVRSGNFKEKLRIGDEAQQPNENNGDENTQQATDSAILLVNGQASFEDVQIGRASTTLATSRGNVGIGGDPLDGARLGVHGNAKITESLDVKTVSIREALDASTVTISDSLHVSKVKIAQSSRLESASSPEPTGGTETSDQSQTSHPSVLEVNGQASFDEIQVGRSPTTLATRDRSVGIGGDPFDGTSLGVHGNAKITKSLDVEAVTVNQSLTIGSSLPPQNDGAAPGEDQSEPSADVSLEVKGKASITDQLDVRRVRVLDSLRIESDTPIPIPISTTANEIPEGTTESESPDPTILEANGNAIITKGDRKAELYVRGSVFVDSYPGDEQNTGGSIYAHHVYGKDTLQAGQFYQLSSRAYKEDIRDLTSAEADETLDRLQPVKYKLKARQDEAISFGFISEDSPDVLTSTSNDSIKIMDVIAMLTKTVQDDRIMMKSLVAKVEEQEREITRLKHIINNETTQTDSGTMPRSENQPTTPKRALRWRERVKRSLRSKDERSPL
jgi:hypothetical protein